MKDNPGNTLKQLKKSASDAFFEHIVFAKSNAFSLLLVAGSDARTFLQGQVTCDMAEITSESASLAAHCTAQGRVVATFTVIAHEENYLLRVPTANVTTLTNALNKYAAFSKVTLKDVSEAYSQINLMGPNCKNTILDSFQRKESRGLAPETRGCGDSQGEYANASLESQARIDSAHRDRIQETISVACPRVVEAQELTQISWPKIAEYPELTRFLLIIPIEQTEKIISRLINAQGDKLATAPSDAEHLWDILAGIPNITPATSERFTPHMLNLDQLGAISFNKGCYIGQEIITRTQHKGTVKRRVKRIERPSEEAKTLETDENTIDLVVCRKSVFALVVEPVDDANH